MRSLFLLFILFFLAGCWSNHELDDSAIVHGVGLDIKEDELLLSFEIVKPAGEGAQSNEEGKAPHIVIENTSDTLLEGAREAIALTKRRLDFGHTKVWIISEELATKDFVHAIDIIRRDQMTRLDSHVFISEDKPLHVLSTPTLYDHLVSSELASTLAQTKFIAQYAPITMREFYKALEGPLTNAYVPIIYLTKNNEEIVTAIDGLAVINDDKMVGKLNTLETTGLNMLLNNVTGGNLQVEWDESEKVSLEILHLRTEIDPVLKGKDLSVSIQTNIEGTLADNMTTEKIDKKFFERLEAKLNDHTEKTIRATLNKLQRELKTDITSIGLRTYRKYVREWTEIQDEWDEIFANAQVDIDVKTTVLHQGLVNENLLREKKPHNNPFKKLRD